MRFTFRSFWPFLVLVAFQVTVGFGHPFDHSADPFRQLEEILPTPGDTRIASGAPGHRYWQQRANYDIAITLDEKTHSITGSETVQYFNNSPDTLTYIWVQLDRNRHSPKSDRHQTREAPNFSNLKAEKFRQILHESRFDGTYTIKTVTDTAGQALPYQIVKTMMRIDLPEPLKPKTSTSFKISWSFPINDRLQTWGRSGYEIFKEDGNAIYQIAQFFPRVAAYTDVNGWQHKQFIGRGEFTLEFGDYKVSITVPADHTVASTGVLQNSNDILSESIQKRLKQAENVTEPVLIVTPEEAKKKLTQKTDETKTWVFHAENVRDFAFASSRRFIWDALQHKLPGSGKKVWAMSYYPPEANPLWSKYSTHAVIHTLNVYSRHTFDYPYPAAISVHGKIWGMEYPMISFNGGRPEEDGTYTEKLKKALISVIIHEVGHNWFPMIINSDERQWTWMDEGLNSFLQSIAEEEWSNKPYNVPSLPEDIGNYMKSKNQRPIMTNSESILQFGNNAYAKPAAALTILRESVMGRELFDFAFKEYANRWRFKRPQPSDFFRSMEDASSVDLDWFWRGWFYTTDHVDVALEGIELYRLDSEEPKKSKDRDKEENQKEKTRNITHSRNKDLPKYIGTATEVSDFYSDFDRYEVTEKDLEDFQEKLKKMEEEDRVLLDNKDLFYVITVGNKGGLVTPVTMEVTTESGKMTTHHFPVEIWKKNPKKIRRLIISNESIAKVQIDPLRETADINPINNLWPKAPEEKYFKIKPKKDDKNPMQLKLQAEKEKSEKKKE